MKSKMLTTIKMVALPIIAFAIIVTGSLSVAFDAQAVEITETFDGENGVKYVQYRDVNPNDYWGVKAPKYTEVDSNGVGYFFAGWYEKIGNSYLPIGNVEKMEMGEITVVAKFVPAQTMSVKCQNQAGVDENSDNVIMRILAGIDSTDYKTAGFVISIIKDGVAGKETTYEINKVYREFKCYKNKEDQNPDVYGASDVFGTAAEYFTTCTVGKIPKNMHDVIVCIKPFWDTLDGVRVYGLSKFAHVEDSYKGYVNIPINLNVLSENDGATAGLLSVTAPEGLTFVGAECGKVFNEMTFNPLSDGRTVRCVGNTSDISNKTEMDVYANLKFQKTGTVSSYTFTVNGEDFEQ